jgi:hypothetical protein
MRINALFRGKTDLEPFSKKVRFRPVALRRRAARATASLRLPRVRRIDRLAVAAEVFKNPLNRGLLLDAGDHPELPAAAPAGLNVDSGKRSEVTYDQLKSYIE